MPHMSIPNSVRHLLLCLLMLFSTTGLLELWAQESGTVAIVDLRAVIGEPQTDHIVLCAEADTLSLIVATIDDISNLTFTVGLPENVSWDGQVYGLDQLGNPLSIGVLDPDTSSPIFDLPDLSESDYLKLYLTIKANCELKTALQAQQPINITYTANFQDVNGENGYDNYTPITPYNTSFFIPVLNILSNSFPAANIPADLIGGRIVREIVISQNGIGAHVDNLIFTNDYDAQEVTLHNVYVNGIPVPPSMLTDTGDEYTLDLDFQALLGFPALNEDESITIQEEFNVFPSCEGGVFIHDYTLSYECEPGLEPCLEDYDIALDQFQSGINPYIKFGVNYGEMRLCPEDDDLPFSLTVDNASSVSDDSQIPFAYVSNFVFKINRNRACNLFPDSLATFSAGGTIVQVPVSIDSLLVYSLGSAQKWEEFYSINLSDAQSDPFVGSGILEDLDGDGYSDDLAFGETFELVFEGELLDFPGGFVDEDCPYLRRTNYCSLGSGSVSYSACGQTYDTSQNIERPYLSIDQYTTLTQSVDCGSSYFLRSCFRSSETNHINECAGDNSVSLELTLPTTINNPTIFPNIRFKGISLSQSEMNWNATTGILTLTPNNDTVNYDDPYPYNGFCFEVNFSAPPATLPEDFALSATSRLIYHCESLDGSCSLDFDLCRTNNFSNAGCAPGTCDIRTIALDVTRSPETRGYTDSSMSNLINEQDMEQYLYPCDWASLITVGEITANDVDDIVLFLGDPIFTNDLPSELANYRAVSARLLDQNGNQVASCDSVQIGPPIHLSTGLENQLVQNTFFADMALDLSCFSVPAHVGYRVELSLEYKLPRTEPYFYEAYQSTYGAPVENLGMYSLFGTRQLYNDAGELAGYTYCPSPGPRADNIDLYSTSFKEFEDNLVRVQGCTATDSFYIENVYANQFFGPGPWDDEYRPLFDLDSLIIGFATVDLDFDFNPTVSLRTADGTLHSDVPLTLTIQKQVSLHGNSYATDAGNVARELILKSYRVDTNLLKSLYRADIEDPFGVSILLEYDLPDRCADNFTFLTHDYEAFAKVNSYSEAYCPEICNSEKVFTRRQIDHIWDDYGNSHVDPRITINHLAPNFVASDDIVTFTTQVCHNGQHTIAASNTWLGFQADLLSYDILDVQLGNTSIGFTDVSHLDGNSHLGIIELGDMAYGTCLELDITVRIRNCDPTPIEFWAGEQCNGDYPTDPREGTTKIIRDFQGEEAALIYGNVIPSRLREEVFGDALPDDRWTTDYESPTVLTYSCFTDYRIQLITVLPTELQVNILQEPPYLGPNCQIETYIVEVKSVRDGPVANLETFLYLPLNGGVDLVAGSERYKYPGDGSYAALFSYTSAGITIAPTGVSNINGEEYQITINNVDGLTGVIDSPNNRLYIAFDVVADCNYESGGFVKLFSQGTNGCGEPINSKVAASDPYYVAGTDPSQFNEYISTIDIAPYDCGDTHSFTINIFDLTTDLAVQPGEEVCFTFPTGLDFVDGSMQAVAPASWDLSSLTTDVVGAGAGFTRVCINLPEGHSGFMQLQFETETNACEGVFIVETHQITEVDCSGNPCELDVITTYGSEQQVQIPSFYEVISISGEVSPAVSCDGEQVQINTILQNATEVPVTGDTEIRYWYDVNENGSIESNIDLMLHLALYTNDIPAMSTISIDSEFDMPSGGFCNLLLDVSTDQCACQQLIHPINDLEFSLPEEITEADAACNTNSDEYVIDLFDQCLLSNYNFTFPDDIQVVQTAGDPVATTLVQQGDTYVLLLDQNTTVNFAVFEVLIDLDSGCGSFTDIIPIVRISPNLNFTLALEEIGPNCFSNFLCYQLDATVGDGSEELMSYVTGFQWNPTTWMSDPTILNPMVCPEGPITYELTISFGETTQNTCYLTDDIQVTSAPNNYDYILKLGPDLNRDCYSDTEVGIDPAFQLEEVPGATYSWTPTTGVSDPSIPNPTFSPIVDTEYTLNVSLPNGCEGSDVMMVTVSNQPDPQLSYSHGQCEGDDFTIGVIIQNPQDHSFAWSGPNNFTANTAEVQIQNASPLDGGDYYVTVTHVNGCEAVQSADIYVQAYPELSLDENLEVCHGDEAIIETTSNAASISWTGPGNFSSTSSTNTISPVLAENEGYYYVSAQNGQCSRTDSLFLDVGTEITLAVDPFASGCYGEDLSVTASSTVSGDYNWTGPDGYFSSGPTLSISNLGSANEGEYFLLFSDQNGCLMEALVQISIGSDECIIIRAAKDQ